MSRRDTWPALPEQPTAYDHILRTRRQPPLFDPPRERRVVRQASPVAIPHRHACPYCHRKWPCEQACTIEPDLSGPGEPPAGSHCACPDPSCQADYLREHPWMAEPKTAPVAKEQMSLLEYNPRVYELETDDE